MLILPHNLTVVPDDHLYRALFDLAEYRRSAGRGRSMEAAYVRDYVGQESKRVKAELKRRSLPATQTVRETPAGQEWQANFNFG